MKTIKPSQIFLILDLIESKQNWIIDMWMDKTDTEPKMKITCPLCKSKAPYKKINNTHIWICETCPFIWFEYFDKKNLKDINKIEIV